MRRTCGRLPGGLALAALLAPGCGDGPADGSAEPVTPQPSDERLAGLDPRVQQLLAGCKTAPRYERDTSWVVPLLVEKLATGEPEPIRRAQEQLGLLGADAGRELLRFVERHYADAFAAPYLENAMAAAGRNDSPAARTALLLGLEHPQEVVRVAALEGLLAGHVRPEDFDELAARLDVPETMSVKRDLARGTFLADPVRAAPLWLDRMERDELPQLWTEVAPWLAESTSPDTGARAALLLERVPQEVAVWLAAAAARHGVAEGLAHARRGLASEVPFTRLSHVRALGRAGLADELVALVDDPDPRVRGNAAGELRSALAEATDPERVARYEAALRGLLDDEAAEVRALVLEVLALRGDEGARDRGLAELQATPERMLAALRALRPAMLQDDELAARALALLVERNARESHRPPAERLATFKAIGLVPSGAAARTLRALARELAGERLQGLRAHEWLMIQAGNTGPAGRAVLAGELERESDPARRLDLLDAVSSARDELARSTLLDVVVQGEDPWEVLFAAARLVSLGPAERVASRIKRAAITVEDGDARRGLRCLLWRWY